MRLKFGLLAMVGALLALGFGQAAQADILADAQAAAKSGDYAIEFRLLRPLANQGNAPAQSNLGFMYATGRGAPKDDVEAVKYYRLAANQGNAGGQYNLGIMYATGRGVPKDDVEAYKWFNLVAAQGVKEAGKFRDDIAAYMTPTQIAEAQKLSREWKPK